MKSFFGYGLLWGAYLLVYYGWTCTQHKGAGILDLALPSRMPNLVAILTGQGGGQVSGTGPTLHALTPSEAGGPLGAGIFVPNAPPGDVLSQPAPVQTLTPSTTGPLGQGLFLP